VVKTSGGREQGSSFVKTRKVGGRQPERMQLGKEEKRGSDQKGGVGGGVRRKKGICDWGDRKTTNPPKTSWKGKGETQGKRTKKGTYIGGQEEAEHHKNYK